MKYVDWITELKQNLLSVPESERRRVMDYYAEAYADRRAAGFSESEIIDGFGAPYDAAQAILEGESPADMPEITHIKSQETAREEATPPPPEPRPAPAPAPAPQTTPAPSAQQPAAKTKNGKMGTGAKVVLIVISTLLVLGIIAFFLSFFVGRAVLKFDEAKYLQETENIQSVRIDFSAGEFRTEFYDGDKIEIDYYESNGHNVSIYERNGTLTFSVKIKWFMLWGSYNTPKETVIKLPKNNVYDLNVDMSAGNITVNGGTFGNINIDMSAGSVNLKGDFVCNKLDIDLSAGKVSADSVECTSLNVDLSAGKVDIDKLTCPVIDIDLSAGSVDFGVIGSKAEYTITVHKSAGSCNVGKQTGTDPNKKISVDLSAGSVNIHFTN